MPVINDDAAQGVPQRLPEVRYRTLFESCSPSPFLPQPLKGCNPIPLICMDLLRFPSDIMTVAESTETGPGRNRK